MTSACCSAPRPSDGVLESLEFEKPEIHDSCFRGKWLSEGLQCPSTKLSFSLENLDEKWQLFASRHVPCCTQLLRHHLHLKHSKHRERRPHWTCPNTSVDQRGSSMLCFVDGG